jgi:hypothetical protein
MRSNSSLLPLLLLSSCFSFGSNFEAGYTQMAVSGNMAFTTGTGGGATNGSQDIQSALGLGQDVGSPYGKATLDFGVPRLEVSAFQFKDEGSGVLQTNFGDLTAGVAVNSRFEFFNIKASYSFDIELGPVRVSPGLAVDFFQMKLEVVDTSNTVKESFDEPLPLPLAFLGGGVDLGIVDVDASVGYLKAPRTQGIEGSALDAEGKLHFHPNRMFDVFAGYRLINLKAKGDFGSDRADIDFDIKGWMVGASLHF